jgi:hypothetical protein
MLSSLLKHLLLKKTQKKLKLKLQLKQLKKLLSNKSNFYAVLSFCRTAF